MMLGLTSLEEIKISVFSVLEEEKQIFVLYHWLLET